jgi:hypothetical protein
MGDNGPRVTKRKGGASATRRPEPAAPSEKTAPETGEPAPWTFLAARILGWYLLLHCFFLLIFIVAPLLPGVREETPPGEAYLGLISINYRLAAMIIVVPLMGVLALSDIWHPAMTKERKFLLRSALLGVALTGLFYIFMLFDVMYELWQGKDAPNHTQLNAMITNCVTGSFIEFSAVLLGLVGASIDALKKFRL